MSKVLSAHAVSVDGYISGRTPGGDVEVGRDVGDAPRLFDWHADGDTPRPVLGAGPSSCNDLSEHLHLRVLEAIPAPGVTHLHYEVIR